MSSVASKMFPSTDSLADNVLVSLFCIVSRLSEMQESMWKWDRQTIVGWFSDCFEWDTFSITHNLSSLKKGKGQFRIEESILQKCLLFFFSFFSALSSTITSSQNVDDFRQDQRHGRLLAISLRYKRVNGIMDHINQIETFRGSFNHRHVLVTWKRARDRRSFSCWELQNRNFCIESSNKSQMDLANPHRTILKWKEIYGPGMKPPVDLWSLIFLFSLHNLAAQTDRRTRFSRSSRGNSRQAGFDLWSFILWALQLKRN